MSHTSRDTELEPVAKVPPREGLLRLIFATRIDERIQCRGERKSQDFCDASQYIAGKQARTCRTNSTCLCMFSMNMQDIRAFVAVAETRSVNRAALRLNLTQPAVTRRIQSFEAGFGEGLVFDRTVKPAALTATGRHVLEHCRRVLSAVAELEACATSATDPSGEMRVGVAHGLGEMVLTTPLDAIRRRFPRIRLQVSLNWSIGLIDELRGGGLDCAVGLLTEAHSIPTGLTAIPLGAEQVVIVSASKTPIKQDGTPWRLRDLAHESWYLNPPGCGCKMTVAAH